MPRALARPAKAPPTLRRQAGCCTSVREAGVLAPRFCENSGEIQSSPSGVLIERSGAFIALSLTCPRTASARYAACSISLYESDKIRFNDLDARTSNTRRRGRPRFDSAFLSAAIGVYCDPDLARAPSCSGGFERRGRRRLGASNRARRQAFVAPAKFLTLLTLQELPWQPANPLAGVGAPRYPGWQSAVSFC
jgi:hypothetical protein